MASFATAINCIDGRTQLPVLTWLRETQQVDYVDLVTEPGADGLLASDSVRAAQLILPRVRLSVAYHRSELIAVVGHHDCAGNPISDDAHRTHLLDALRRVLDWQLGTKVMALWVGSDWQVDVVAARPSA